eukprot:CCRYP_003525-RA/>CCRYP_003525-RA protein AED:0.07 eAED:0.07 QI:0/0/0/0.33/1/1/3/0/474
MPFSILAIAILAHGAKWATATSSQGSNPHPFTLTSIPQMDRKDKIVFPTSDAVRRVAQGSAVAHYEQTRKAFLPNLSQKLNGPRREPDHLVNTQGRKMKSSDWVQLGLDIDGEDDDNNFVSSISLSGDGSVLAIGAPYHSPSSRYEAGTVRVFEFKGTGWTQLGLSIDGEAEGDNFGSSVCLSSDGSVLAIGAPHHDANVGTVRVFKFNGTGWTQLGLSIDGGAQADNSGKSVALSSDGNMLAIGAPGLDGQVRVFEFNGTGWTQLGLSIDGEAEGDNFGSSVCLSSDGSVLAIGAPYHDSMVGTVRVFKFNGTGWTQLGLSIDGEYGGGFGWSVALSSDGNMLAIGAPYKSPKGTVRVFEFNDFGWTQLGLSIDGEAEWDEFGSSVCLSSDGSVLAVRALASELDSDGYVQVFKLDGTTGWSQLGLKIEGEGAGISFGTAVSLSSNGRVLAVGAPQLNTARYVGVYKAIKPSA